MALVYAASISPSKSEAIAGWLPAQPWAPAFSELRLLGAFRFDDPGGEVGIESHLVRCDDGDQTLLQVPLTYRGAPLEGAESSLVCTMEHSELGPRWVYDGCADPAYLAMLATVTLTGVGQAADLQVARGEQRARPPTVRLSGAGWITDPVRVDGWAPAEHDGAWAVVRSPSVELRLSRRPAPTVVVEGATLVGTWAGQADPALLATATLTGTLTGTGTP